MRTKLFYILIAFLANILTTRANITPGVLGFFDRKVEELCLANWDTNGDHQLSTYEAAAVTSLGEVFKNTDITAFDNLGHFTGLTSIGDHAFYGCYALTRVIIPTSVTRIGDFAFEFCNSLTSIKIRYNVTSIGRYAFDGCSDLTSVVSYVQEPFSFGDFAFNGISSDCVLTVPAGTKDAYIAKGWTTDVFKGGIVEAAAPSSNIAFADASVKALCVANFDTGDGELSEAEAAAVANLGEVFGETEITSFDELQYFTGLTSIDDRAFSGCFALARVTIPTGVTRIGNYAFECCESLTSITIPYNVMSIGNFAFDLCRNLTSVVSYVQEPFSFGYFAFNDISSNCVLTVPAGTKNAYIAAGWTEEVFKGGIVEMSPNIDFADANVKAICVANWDTNNDGELSEAEAAAVTSLGEVFKENTEITSFDELQYFTGLTSIGSQAFYRCTGLTSVTIPSSVTSMESNAFFGCKDLTRAEFASLESLCNISFEYVDSNPLYYAHHLFVNDEEITDLVIPNTVNSIGKCTFSGCEALNSVTIPNSVYRIGSGAFSSTKIKNIIIPNSVTSLEAGCFTNAIIDRIEIPYSETPIICNSTSRYSRIFDFATIGELYINRRLTWPQGTLYNYQFAPFGNNCKIDKIYGTGIDEGIFEEIAVNDYYLLDGCTDVKQSYSFYQWSDSNPYGYSTIKNLHIPEGVTSITRVFSAECINLPSTLNIIASNAFDKWAYLKQSLVLPASLQTIGDNAFSSATSIYSITCMSETPIAISENVFSSKTYEKTLYVPLGSGTAYHNATGWREFAQIVEFGDLGSLIQFADEEVKRICVQYYDINGDGEFSEGEAALITNLQGFSASKIQFFDELGTYFANLESFSFSGCSQLLSVTIPASVMSIGNYAFFDCTGLKSITIPNSVISIGNYAFADCTSLTSVVAKMQEPCVITTSVFRSISSECVLTVPAGTKNAYIAAGWTEEVFKGGIVEMDGSVSVTLGSAGAATFCSVHDLDFFGTDDVKAYIVSAFSPSAGEVMLTRVYDVPAGTGIVLLGNAGTYDIPIGTGETVTSNLLVGTTADKTLYKVSGSYTNFVLANGASGLGFYTVADGSVLAAGKAYLPLLTAGLPSSAAQFSFRFNDDGTSFIRSLDVKDSREGDDWFSLDGRQLNAEPTAKSLYIRNGRKVIVR